MYWHLGSTTWKHVDVLPCSDPPEAHYWQTDTHLHS